MAPAAWALERADLEPGARVLDVGSGDSIFPVYLARSGHRVSAVDLELDGSLGRRHRVPIHYILADMTALPFDAASFDAVFCISVIEHLPEPRIAGALEEMRRVLRPGSPLLLTTDYYHDADAEIWHRSPGLEFRVDWGVFDEPRLRRLILGSVADKVIRGTHRPVLVHRGIGSIARLTRFRGRDDEPRDASANG